MTLRKIRMVVSLAGPDVSFEPGQEYDVEEAFAVALCTLPAETPRAVAVGWDPHDPNPAKPAAKKPARRESAAFEPGETAALPPAKKRARPSSRRR